MVARAQNTHTGEVQHVADMLADACDQAASAIERLSEDGAQPHLIAALSSAEHDLRAQHVRLARTTVV